MPSSDAPTPKKMDFKPTTKDEKILGYICKNYSCKICNSILIQCMTLSCGHQYCNYCLDMLMGGKSPKQSTPCPHCSSPIKYAQPNDGIDQKIDDLIHSCSKPIHKAYTVALNNRFQKSLDRSKRKHEARIQQHQSSLQNGDDNRDGGEGDSSKISGSSFDDICKALMDSSGNGSTPADSEQSLAEVLKSAAVKQGKGKMVNPTTVSRKGSSRRPKSEEIDIDKVNSLFGIYDHILQHGGKDNEPEKELAGGDFTRADDIDPEEPLEGMRNFAKKSDLELTALIKEADDIIRLDDHIQQWAKRMTVALDGSGESDPTVANSSEGAVEEKDKHNVKDELWSSSNQLLRKLKGLQSQRQEVLTRLSIHLPTLPPPPRSAKLDLDGISDDSDVEEYEEALLDLQDSMKNQLIPMIEDVETETSSPPPNVESSAGGSEQKCSRRRGRLDFAEESGLSYIKENIQFIGQMRKYKEALMKIQNREVETAQEIKELLPFRESRGESPTPTGNKLKAKPHTSPGPSKSPRPRVAHYSPMRAPSPSSQAQQKQRPPQFSTRLPPSSHPSRPRTASSPSYETRPTSPFHHQLLPKLYMKRSRGGNGTCSAYNTAR